MKFIAFCLICGAAYASGLSLMLTPDEESALVQAEERSKKGAGESGQIPHALRLDGIIYSHPESWTIWLNGRPIKAGESIDSLHILSVTPESVEIVWCPKPGQRHEILLRPNDTFQGTPLPSLPDNCPVN